MRKFMNGNAVPALSGITLMQINLIKGDGRRKKQSDTECEVVI